jgi:hypothetical protein
MLRSRNAWLEIQVVRGCSPASMFCQFWRPAGTAAFAAETRTSARSAVTMMVMVMVVRRMSVPLR